MICNPYAIFKNFIANECFNDYFHYWVINDFEKNKFVMEAYKQYPNIKFVLHNSKTYLKLLATAKFLINNTSFPSFFSKKEGQIFINTWHSTTVKKLGFDVPNGIFSVNNMLRNFLMSDILIAENYFMKKVFLDSFKLNNLFTGKILTIGQLRNELLFTEKKGIVGKLRKNNIAIENHKKIVLFAPTWRGSNYCKTNFSIQNIENEINNIRDRINLNEFLLLFKPHQTLYKSLIKIKTDIPFEYIPSTIDTNELLSITDILITDYSSICFDFIPRKKPIIFYIPDLNEYQEYRGLEIPLEKLPGPIETDIEKIGPLVCDANEWFPNYRVLYEETQKWLLRNEIKEYGGKTASDIIIDYIVKSPAKTRASDSIQDSNKRKLLFYAMDFRMNGVTVSFLSLLKKIDYSKFDVSLVLPKVRSSTQKQLVSKINKNVRVFYRKDTFSATIIESVRYNVSMYLGIDGGLKKIIPEALFRREFIRCFGNAEFDYVIDFSGYGSFFPLLFLYSGNTKKYIWQHNDLKKDQNKAISTKWVTNKIRELRLKSVFSLYPYFDKIVSCSSYIMEVNRKNLSRKETYNKFTYATNTVDVERILEGTSLPLSDDLQVLIDLHPIKFVTVGRLAEEKNHKNLITAFKNIVSEKPEACLFIIGEGVEKERIENQIIELELSNNIILLGVLENPFNFIQQCDCFILASKYEGQGLVLVEARTLHLPIITTNFDAVYESIDPARQKVVTPDVEGLVEGMRSYIEGKVEKDYLFDVEAYNNKNYLEFEKLFL